VPEVGDLIREGAAAILAVMGWFALFAVLVAVSVLVHLNRRQQLRTWARRRGWQHHHDRSRRRAWLPLVCQFWRRAQITGDILTGVHDGWQVTVVPAWDRNVNDNVRHHVIVVVAVPQSLPTLGIRPRRHGPVAGAGMLGSEITTGHAAFDARYRVRTPDPSGARLVLTPAVCESLVKLAPAPMQFQGQWVAVHARARPTPQTIEQLVSAATATAAAVCAAR
jgi:hypothetical protein